MVYNAGMSLTALSHPVLSTDVADINSFPMSSELTIAQAARFLDGTEGLINELLDAGMIASRLEDGEHLIQVDSLIDYEQDMERRLVAADKLFSMFREMGLSDD
jgi:hypothetical protein